MKTTPRLLAAAMFCGALCAFAVAADKENGRPADAGWVSLFNGKNLDGWHGDPDLWKVVDGAIVGSTDNKELTHNSFLSTDKPYKNFVLRIKFKLRNHNSGVQFRSKEADDFVVSGYQADMAEKRYTGILYEERGRGILADVQADGVEPHLHHDDWNEYLITADGPHIELTLNGFTTVDYNEKSDEGAKDGVIALQLHAGPKMQVQFKDIEIKELP